MLEAVRNNWRQLGEAEAAWRQVGHLFAKVFRNTWNFISSGRRDREIVLAAVCQEQSQWNRQAVPSRASICSCQDCMALQFASEDLREDPEIIMAVNWPRL